MHVIVIDRPDLKIRVELKPFPPEPAQYIEIYIDNGYEGDWINLTAAEAIMLADALLVAATRGRLVEP